MFRVIIAAVLMLSMAVVLTAQYGGINREEYSRRANELNRLAEKIKQETGFEGRINTDPARNRITRIEGNFEDIRVPAREDTSGFEQVFDEILDRVLPYFPVNRVYLNREPLSSSVITTGVRFKQTANGYDIEGGGRLNIYYNHRLERFSVVNGLAYLDPAQLPTEPVITEEEAIRIFYENTERKRPDFKLMYCTVRTDSYHQPFQYKLAWRSDSGGLVFIIDAINGEIMANFDATQYNHTVNERGTVIPNTAQEVYDATPDTVGLELIREE